MTHSIISKALVIGSMLISAYASNSFAGQDIPGQQAVDAPDAGAVITREQQQKWEITMLSWQRNIADSLQKDRDNTLLLKDNIDYQKDAVEFSAELGSVRDHIVQN